MIATSIGQYWQTYQKTFPARRETDRIYHVDAFGDTPTLANELGELVLEGIKTASCSALWEWEAEQTALPKVGMKTVVIDGAENPLCIIETTEVVIRPFNEVDARFARDEGEDDLSLEWWRREHWKYFSRVLPKIGKEPTLDMLLVCERFRVVYRS
ncbi:ASCH domain-containing protein [Lusitaniella coriacea LEGE 07157]|uniref:ASCH domain-containing protein n=1 Tax=Lusitaniella coriacea LEGE 07157 TaxID=945747 RepID=A0A8J7IS12_9CYAN|nr:ASCH domain-containing protein [Lusitaniella coriacea]MBE9115832.1 ASCH domain-containing protein [Lusitaniella coriacea LEGE 07157]